MINDARISLETFVFLSKPHRGKTTEAEKETVRNNLNAINERLTYDPGQR